MLRAAPMRAAARRRLQTASVAFNGARSLGAAGWCPALSSLSTTQTHARLLHASVPSADAATPQASQPAASKSSSGPLYQHYEALVTEGRLRRDAAQEEAVAELDKFIKRFRRYATLRLHNEVANRVESFVVSRVPPPLSPVEGAAPAQGGAGAASATTSGAAAAPSAGSAAPAASAPKGFEGIAAVPRGLYLWGGVGIGKSMLMDTLFTLGGGAAAWTAVPPPSQTEVLAEVARRLEKRGYADVTSVLPTAFATLPGGAEAAYQEAVRAALPPSTEPASSATSAPALCAPARRVHFHSFMLEVHARVHAWKQASIAIHGRSKHIDVRPERDAIVQVAKAMAGEAWLLCFDEFQVTDVADAMIMGRLFTTLFNEGVVMIATSNRPPDDLYANGLNREYFMPFLSALKAMCKTHLLDSGVDYRRVAEGGGGGGALLLAPPRAAAAAAATALAERFGAVGSGGRPITTAADLETLPLVEVPVMMGRTLTVRSATPATGSPGPIAVLSFEEACARAVGAADYLALCEAFPIVVLYGVPRLRRHKHNEARRLITLVDELYEHRTQLILVADKHPDELFALASATTPSSPAPVPGSNLPLASRTDPAATDDGAEVIGRYDEDEPELDAEEDADGAEGGMPSNTGPVSTASDSAVNRLPGAVAAAPVISVVTSAAERASLGELAFACRRAVSRILELTR